MDRLQREFLEASHRFQVNQPEVVLTLDPSTILCLIASVQLALRHPGNTGESARRMRGLIDTLIGRIGEIEPRLAELLRMGDDPKNDKGR